MTTLSLHCAALNKPVPALAGTSTIQQQTTWLPPEEPIFETKEMQTRPDTTKATMLY